jgi:uncharacterized repeat protein (TIGR03803 family)
VFKLKASGSGWVFIPLYAFQGIPDGAKPWSRVVFGPNGILYGTTVEGGVGGCGGSGCGTAFSLRPPPHAQANILGGWIESVPYRFSGGSDGSQPFYGDLIFDQAGDIYGTTEAGGAYGQGTVYELTASGSSWTENTLYSFTGKNDGGFPWSGVIFDSLGNLYGTTWTGGVYLYYGTVFELTPSKSGWMENTLYTFTGGSDGGNPVGGLIFDQSGNLYGTADVYGSGNGGTVFELTPHPLGNWVFSLLYSLSGNGRGGPAGSLAMDAAGNLYGTTFTDGIYGWGSVFKLTPSGGSWTYTALHDFTDGSDGGQPFGNVTFDAKGNLYGTTYVGGAYNAGVVWEITP